MKPNKPSITIGFTSHRIETLAFAKQLMEEHDIIITEEAPNSRFIDMLNRKISITKYIREEYLEFPKFSWRYYKLLRKFHYAGKKILQIEPYMKKLFIIYEMFSDGKKPSDVLDIPVLKEVYIAEKNATAALLDFYERSLKSSFQEIVEAVIRFARFDAERFRLRDTMRADAIAKTTSEDKKFYIEAGGIHIFFEKILRQKLGRKYHINAVSLLEPFIQKITGEREFLPPGDLLTIHYILGKRKNEQFENLQAARSLIYIMLLNKEEMIPSKTIEAPHIEHEVKINELVNRLSVKQCEELYKKIRFKKREEALKTL